jgi:hypothetical protein
LGTRTHRCQGGRPSPAVSGHGDWRDATTMRKQLEAWLQICRLVSSAKNHAHGLRPLNRKSLAHLACSGSQLAWQPIQGRARDNHVDEVRAPTRSINTVPKSASPCSGVGNVEDRSVNGDEPHMHASVGNSIQRAVADPVARRRASRRLCKHNRAHRSCWEYALKVIIQMMILRLYP